MANTRTQMRDMERRDQRIWDLYGSGNYTMAQVGEKVGLSREGVRLRLNRMGLTSPRARPLDPTELIGVLDALHPNAGVTSYRDLMAYTGRSQNSIHRLLRDGGVLPDVKALLAARRKREHRDEL